ncbi:MAG: cupin domain-containing protein [Defluviitaleaceae bacterium]|nr:cupin domain-containing protein [Defluviitaleaceae bacterium]
MTQDFGGRPFVVDIEKATVANDTFRTAIWSGSHLQVTVMSVEPGDDLGLEQHNGIDQFLRVEQGKGMVQMGEHKDDLSFVQPIFENSAVFVPANIWHNITNTGRVSLKLYSVYAPPDHPFGTIHPTKEIAEKSENH